MWLEVHVVMPSTVLHARLQASSSLLSAIRAEDTGSNRSTIALQTLVI